MYYTVGIALTQFAIDICLFTLKGCYQHFFSTNFHRSISKKSVRVIKCS
jgi:hypothetical protein